jgi:hypothetical protein
MPFKTECALDGLDSMSLAQGDEGNESFEIECCQGIVGDHGVKEQTNRKETNSELGLSPSVTNLWLRKYRGIIFHLLFFSYAWSDSSRKLLSAFTLRLFIVFQLFCNDSSQWFFRTSVCLCEQHAQFFRLFNDGRVL